MQYFSPQGVGAKQRLCVYLSRYDEVLQFDKLDVKKHQTNRSSGKCVLVGRMFVCSLLVVQLNLFITERIIFILHIATPASEFVHPP